MKRHKSPLLVATEFFFLVLEKSQTIYNTGQGIMWMYRWIIQSVAQKTAESRAITRRVEGYNLLVFKKNDE